MVVGWKEDTNNFKINQNPYKQFSLKVDFARNNESDNNKETDFTRARWKTTEKDSWRADDETTLFIVIILLTLCSIIVLVLVVSNIQKSNLLVQFYLSYISISNGVEMRVYETIYADMKGQYTL